MKRRRGQPEPGPGAAPGLARLRGLCRRLPGVTETFSYGHPNFKAGGWIFAAWEMVRGRPSIAVRLDADLQSLLIDEVRFFPTPYGARQGWVSAWMDRPVDWRLLGRLIRKAHRLATGPAAAQRPATRRRAARRSAARPARSSSPARRSGPD